MSRFEGLRSRWTIPSLLMWERASRIWRKRRHDSSSDSPRAMAWSDVRKEERQLIAPMVKAEADLLTSLSVWFST